MEIKMTVVPKCDPIDRNEVLIIFDKIYESEHIGGLLTEKGKVIALCIKIVKSIPSVN